MTVDHEPTTRAPEPDAVPYPSGFKPASKRPLRAMMVLAGLIALVVCLLVLLLPSGTPPLTGRPVPPTGHTTTTLSRPATAAVTWTPAIGVYSGPGQVTAAQQFSGQSGVDVPYALDFLPSSTWSQIANPSWTLQQWQASKFHMIYGVPMLPRSGSSLAAGATGAYDANFTALATLLVGSGQGNAVLMIGWDPLQSGTAWAVGNAGEAVAYVSYWRQIVTTMRAVPGAAFQFEWNGGTPSSTISPATLYPGDRYVDYIATNVFDRLLQPEGGSRWADVSQVANGPDWFAQFAADHHKPFVIGEWGLLPALITGGGGDDPAFVRQFLKWCGTTHVALAVTWNYGTWDVMSPSFPESAAVLAKAVATGASAPATAALAGPQPGT